MAVAVVLLPFSPGKAGSLPTWNAAGDKGAVAAGSQEAVDVGIGILRHRGNAVDAAVATILALSVTDSKSFCFGGEVPNSGL